MRIAVNLQREFNDKKVTVSLLETGEEKEEKKSEKDHLKEITQAIQHLIVSKSPLAAINIADFFDISFKPVHPIHFCAVPTPPP